MKKLIWNILDLRNMDISSEAYVRKVSRAHEALTMGEVSGRTLSATLSTKYPYKRTMSAPADMVNKAMERQAGKLNHD